MRCDLHTHSFYSLRDGVNSPEDIIKQAVKVGLDSIAITDHDTLNGFLNGKKYAKEVEFDLVPGMEISSKEGHILGLYIGEEVPKGLSAEETLELIHAQGGLAIAAHPYDLLRNGVGDIVKKLDFDGIEILNGRNYFVNGRAKKVAKTLDIATTGGSDGHIIDEVGNCYTTYENDLYNAIKNKKTGVGGGLANPYDILKSKIRAKLKKRL
ncbi:MAG: PHP domain-containing protein [Euryarchaeota archaeon]|nr:PHP domain-containing protein [Euryarchaeota archaeon]